MSTATTKRQELPLGIEMSEQRCSDLFVPDYLGVAAKARDFAKKHDIASAALDKFRICVVQIDNQIGFCMREFQGVQLAPLYVAGAEADCARAGSFILRNLDVITTNVVTMDTHKTWQIFFECILIDDAGNHPDPLAGAMVTAEEVKQGKWKINPAASYAILRDPKKYMALQKHLEHYTTELDGGSGATGDKYALQVWPYHCMLGGIDHALVPAMQEVCFFHDIARGTQTIHEIKGGNPLTENYSPFCPEVLTTPDGKGDGGTVPIAQRNASILQMILEHDAVFILGQAKSHCVKWAIDDLLTQIKAQDPKLAQKVHLVEDCTSPVVIPGVIDFTPQGNEAFARFRDEGMNVVDSTTPLTDYLPL